LPCTRAAILDIGTFIASLFIQRIRMGYFFALANFALSFPIRLSVKSTEVGA